MKKVLSVLIAAFLLFPALAAMAEETAVTSLDLSELAGVPTHYHLFDRAVFEQPDEHPGQVVKIKYKNDLYDKPYTNYISVYLPYGYDENGTERYPVVYFLHGNGGDSTTLLGNPETVNTLDHMISSGIAKPFILVAPSYYYDQRHKSVDLEIFVRELREELMPMIEGTYRTYAETPDEAGFRASRDARAICGFSRGSFTTWYLFDKMLDVSRTFLPFSGAIGLMEGETTIDSIRAAIDAHDLPYFIYMACGGEEDLAYAGCSALAQELIKDEEHFSYGTDVEKNHFFYVQSDNIHQDLTSRYYLFNAFVDGVLWPVSDAQE